MCLLLQSNSGDIEGAISLTLVAQRESARHVHDMVVFALLLSRPRHFHCVVSVMCCIASSIGDGVGVCSARLCHVVLHRKTDSAVSTRLRTVWLLASATARHRCRTRRCLLCRPAAAVSKPWRVAVACHRRPDDQVVCSDSFCRDVDGLLG